jgi:DNA-binding MarR family transcriptional regulator
VTRGPEREIGLLFDLFAAEERVGQLLRLALADTGLKPAEYAVTSVLAGLGPTTPTEIARITGTRPSTLSGHLGALTRRGLVRRVPAPVDGRSALLELTTDGERVQRSAVVEVKRHMARLRAELGTPLPALRAALHDLADALDRTITAGDVAGQAR